MDRTGNTLFPIWQSTVEAFDYCWQERRALVRFGWIPLLVTIAASLAAEIIDADWASDRTKLIVLALVQAVVFLPVAVTWYRMVVMGAEEAARRPIFALGRLEAQLLRWQILIVLVLGAAGVVGSLLVFGVYTGLMATGAEVLAVAVAVVLGVGLLSALLFTASRLAMVLVLVAVEQPVSLKEAWRVTDGLGWRLVAVTIVVGVINVVAVLMLRLAALVVGMIGAMVIGTTADRIAPYITLLGENVGALVFFVVMATVFGALYRKLTATEISAR